MGKSATSRLSARLSTGNVGASYFWRAAVLYALFNVVISPLQYWFDIFDGWRFGDASLANLPFVQGCVFFYSIVLNSDSIFRASQHVVSIAPEEHRSVKVWGAMIANFVLLVFSFHDYGALQKAVADHLTKSFPIIDQVILLALALATGCFLNHIIAKHEASRYP